MVNMPPFSFNPLKFSISDLGTFSVNEFLLYFLLLVFGIIFIFYILKSIVGSFFSSSGSHFCSNKKRKKKHEKNQTNSDLIISYLISFMLGILCCISLISLLYFYNEKSSHINDAREYISRLILAINKFKGNIIERLENYKKIILSSVQNSNLLIDSSTDYHLLIKKNITHDMEKYLSDLRLLKTTPYIKHIIATLDGKLDAFQNELEALFKRQCEPLSPIPRYKEILEELDLLIEKVKNNSSNFLSDASVMISLIEKSHILCTILVIVIVLLSIFLLLLSLRHRISTTLYPSLMHQIIILITWIILLYFALNPEFYMVPILELPSSSTMQMKSDFPKIIDTILKGIRASNNESINVLLSSYIFETEDKSATAAGVPAGAPADSNIVRKILKSFAPHESMLDPNFESNRYLFDELRENTNDVELFRCNHYSISTKDLLRVKMVLNKKIFKEIDHCGVRIGVQAKPNDPIKLHHNNILGLIMYVSTLRDNTNITHSYPSIRLECQDNIWATLGLGEGNLKIEIPHSSKFDIVCKAYFNKYKGISNDFIEDLMKLLNSFNYPSDDDYIVNFMKIWTKTREEVMYRTFINNIKKSHEERMEAIRMKLRIQFKENINSLIPLVFGVNEMFEEYMQPIMNEFTRIFNEFGPIMKLLSDGFGLSMSFWMILITMFIIAEIYLLPFWFIMWVFGSKRRREGKLKKRKDSSSSSPSPSKRRRRKMKMKKMKEKRSKLLNDQMANAATQSTIDDADDDNSILEIV